MKKLILRLGSPLGRTRAAIGMGAGLLFIGLLALGVHWSGRERAADLDAR